MCTRSGCSSILPGDVRVADAGRDDRQRAVLDRDRPFWTRIVGRARDAHVRLERARDVVSAVVNPWTRPRSIGLLSMVRSMRFDADVVSSRRRPARGRLNSATGTVPFDRHPLGGVLLQAGVERQRRVRRSPACRRSVSYLNSPEAAVSHLELAVDVRRVRRCPRPCPRHRAGR